MRQRIPLPFALMMEAPLSQWPRLSVLLNELLDLDTPALTHRLAELREEDPTMADAVEGLLGRITSVERDGFLQQTPKLPAQTLAGQIIGAYQIEREIGQGGMGTVWLARRTDGRFEGRVAIKFLATGFASRGGAARFTREGSILAKLAHSHIARLLDAGLSDGKQPYLVLDYVDGLPIDQYCNEAGLDVSARVRLCLDVLDAVAHAHTRLILHRDIKPGNILVTADGEVKLLDFGIAKLLDDQTGAGHATELTRESGNAFTWRYAAPEQVQGGDVTTATDVFALGVLLHLLLTGQHPGAHIGDKAEPPMERMRQLIEVVPPPMSQALAQAGEAKRARALRGDLDTIVAKALKKQPAERYANAEQMADDLRRWLQDEPILARRDARLYRLHKFIFRYRAGVALGTLAFAGLSIGIGLALWQAAEARGQHMQAEGLIEFMLGDLRTKLQPVGRLDALDVVGEKALAYYAAQDESQLDANSLGRRARALHLIGEIAESRGKLDDAIRRFAEAEKSTAALLTRAPQDEQRIFDHAQSVYWVGYVAWRLGQLKAAEQAFRRYEALAEQLISQDPGRTQWQEELAYAHQNLGTVMLKDGRFAEARSMLLAAQVRLKAMLPNRPELIAEVANNMSWVARADERLGQLSQAIAGLQARNASLAARPDSDNDRQTQRDIAAGMSETSRLQMALGQADAAAHSAQQALAAIEALVRADPANTLWRQDLVAAHLRLGEAQRSARGYLAAARNNANKAQTLLQELLAQNANVADWRVNLTGQVMLLQTQVAGRTEQPAALIALRRWLDSLDSTETDSLLRPPIARAGLLVGDGLHESGHTDQARHYWNLAADQVDDGDTAPEPTAAACAAQASTRLGDTTRARRLATYLQTTEFRHPDHAGPVRDLATP